MIEILLWVLLVSVIVVQGVLIALLCRENRLLSGERVTRTFCGDDEIDPIPFPENAGSDRVTAADVRWAEERNG